MKKSRRINKRKINTKRRARYRSKTRKNNHKIWIMKGGGLRAEDCRNIGIDYAYRFNNPDSNPSLYTNLLRSYMFGTKLQEDAWMNLLRLCKDNNIPVYILTSGNKVGIIRMLQLTVIDRYITEVLCTHPQGPVNPKNTSETHNFHEKDKYEVIQSIVIEHGLPTGLCSPPIGYFLDDDKVNFVKQQLCLSIEHKCVLSVRKDEHDDDVPRVPPGFDDNDLKNNEIYKLTVEHLRITPIDDRRPDFNFTPISIIEEVFAAVKRGTIRILFLDFDKTLQIHNMAISFHQIKVLKHFSDKDIPIIEFARLP
jgi:hypothetical protein